MNLVSYTTDWSQLFQKEKNNLTSLLGSEAVDVQHIGSTAIPGIASKPIVDIIVLLPSFQDALKYIDRLQELGYEYSEERSSTERHFFTKGEPVTVHLSLTDRSTSYWDRQIIFREYLLHHPDAAKEYEALKRSLIQRYPEGREEYSSGKSEFISIVLKKAGFSAQ
ncbi:MAG: GrpB family protein [bacterium]|nr:GrpB family protein [bacterium]